MERSPKSLSEVERLLLHELQGCVGCEGAAGVSVIGWGSDTPDHSLDNGPNWTVSTFNAGTANDYECERALMKIVPRLQGYYELVQKH